LGDQSDDVQTQTILGFIGTGLKDSILQCAYCCYSRRHWWWWWWRWWWSEW